MKKSFEQIASIDGFKKSFFEANGVSILALILACAALIIVLVFGALKQGNGSAGPGNSLPEGLQAVFLTNGQVYFGTVSQMDQDTLSLEGIYYLQTDRQGVNAARMDAQSDLQLVKLGNELHGPEDMMQINREHILFIEKLKEDSKVAKAIGEYVGK